MKNKIKINSIIGEFTWEEVRNILIYRLHICETEKDFIKIFQGIINSIGTYKDLKELRKKLSIYPHTEEDKKKMGVNERIKKIKGWGRTYGY